MGIAVSSWALHRTIGTATHDSPETGRQPETRHSEQTLPLEELPAALAEHGFRTLQLCHFHLPFRDRESISRYRAALETAGVELLTLLIDEGDVTDPVYGERDEAWIASWLETARQLGAKRARVIAGKQPFGEAAMARSIAALGRLADAFPDLRIETENWFPTLSTPEAVNAVLDALEGRVGLCLDWGNWPRETKSELLPQIAHRAETCHAKFEFLASGALDEEDAVSMIGVCKAAGFSGFYVIVNGGAGSEWDALEVQRQRLIQIE